MGPPNLALWRKWNIIGSRHSKANNCITHPLDTARNICIFADVPHVFKNLKKMLVTNEVIYLTEEIQAKYDLPTNVICIKHILDLIKYQKNFNFLLAPKLNEEDLLPDHFKKMKVKISSNIVNHDVASSLKFISDELQNKQYLTTAWFIDILSKWFYYMTSRHPACALSRMRETSYNNAIQFLHEFIEIILNLYVGESRLWKPSQTGAIISTMSVLTLQHHFVIEKNNSFLLTSRFSQDCVENLFSSVRVKQPLPTAVQFKNNLRLLSICQYLKNPSKTNYAEDDRVFLGKHLQNRMYIRYRKLI